MDDKIVTAGGAMKVLIVEDDEATRFFLVKVAKDQGCETRSAANGVEGLSAFDEFQPEFIFSDIRMPKMDGLQMLEKIRKTDNDVLVVIISSLDSPEYTLKALRLKANDFLVKPLLESGVTAIMEKYREIFGNRTREREVVGMIYSRDLGMKISNQLDLVGKVVDRLMQEAKPLLPIADRLGIRLGLIEFITNAIEHGSLEVNYEEKTKAMGVGLSAWQDLIASRRKTFPYSQRKVDVRFKYENNRCEWVITDEGPGFDWRKVPDPNDPENLLILHGRGILLSRLQFNEVSYLGKGELLKKGGHAPPFASRSEFARLIPCGRALCALRSAFMLPANY